MKMTMILMKSKYTNNNFNYLRSQFILASIPWREGSPGAEVSDCWGNFITPFREARIDEDAIRSPRGEVTDVNKIVFLPSHIIFPPGTDVRVPCSPCTPNAMSIVDIPHIQKHTKTQIHIIQVGG